MCNPNRHCRPGFTLIELVVASATATVLMGGLAASLYIAGQSLEVGTTAQTTKQGSQQTLTMIHRDLQSALQMSELTATAVTMRVPDRDADGAAETIRYAWSGVVGDPLTQAYNGGTATPIATDVQAFSLAWVTRLVQGSPPSPGGGDVGGEPGGGEPGGGEPGGGGSGVAVQEVSETPVDGSAGSIAIDLPANTVAGDLLIAAVATDGDTKSSITAPAGWNLIEKDESSSAVTLAVWWKLADANESPTQQFSWSGGQEAYGWMMRFTGHDPANPINASAVQITGGGDTETPPSPEVTTTVDNAVILRLGGFDDDDVTTGDPGLPGHTPINMDESGSGSGSTSGGSGWVLQTTAGASGTSTFSLTDDEQAVAITIAIAPDPNP